MQQKFVHRRHRSLQMAVAGIVALVAGWAFADPQPISPSAFRDYVEGHTLYFSEGGTHFGSESFLSGDRSVWRYSDGACVPGRWRAHGAQICFSYADGNDELCWRFLRDGEVLIARLLGQGPDEGLELRVERRDRVPVLCGGPDA